MVLGVMRQSGGAQSKSAKQDTVIRPFAQLLNGKNTVKYKPFTAGAHLERMLIRDFPSLNR